MDKIKIGITHGDINGISYEIIINTLIDTRILDFCIPIVYGSPKVAAYYRKELNITNFNFNNITTADKAHTKRANIIDCAESEITVEMGKSTKEAGQAAFSALERATQDLKDGLIDVLITAPINKNNIQSDKFKFNGHTEYLQEKFNSKESLMLLVNNNLRVGVVVGHTPVKDIASFITKDKIISKLKAMHNSLKNDFNITKPKIAVLGLNPHSGDNGTIGDEEIKIIIPAIEEAREQKIMAIGPFAADGFFGSDNYTKFDAILSMYHDQGLTAFKTIAFNSGVNFTAGLPYVRTSPAHGTAYELTGANTASNESFREALYLAIDAFKNRKDNLKLQEGSMDK